MPTIPEPNVAQTALRISSDALLLIGGAAIASGLGWLKKRRGVGRTRPSSGQVVLGVVLMAGGLAAHLLRRDPEPEPEIINAAVFSSSLAPTVSVTAPPPWRFEHDAQKGQLTGLRPGAVFMIETSFINDSAGGAPAILDAVGKGLRSRGATPVGQPFTQPVAGLDASGQIMTVGIGSSALWVVPRGGTLFTVIVCTSESGPDARTACDPVLSTLKWRRPGPR